MSSSETKSQSQCQNNKSKNLDNTKSEYQIKSSPSQENLATLKEATEEVLEIQNEKDMDKEYLIKKGNDFFKTGDFASAIKVYSHGIKRFPNHGNL